MYIFLSLSAWNDASVSEPDPFLIAASGDVDCDHDDIDEDLAHTPGAVSFPHKAY